MNLSPSAGPGWGGKILLLALLLYLVLCFLGATEDLFRLGCF